MKNLIITLTISLLTLMSFGQSYHQCVCNHLSIKEQKERELVIDKSRHRRDSIELEIMKSTKLRYDSLIFKEELFFKK